MHSIEICDINDDSYYLSFIFVVILKRVFNFFKSDIWAKRKNRCSLSNLIGTFEYMYKNCRAILSSGLRDYLNKDSSDVACLLVRTLVIDGERARSGREGREWKSCGARRAFCEQKIHSHVLGRLNNKGTVRHLSRRRSNASITCLQILPS